MALVIFVQIFTVLVAAVYANEDNEASFQEMIDSHANTLTEIRTISNGFPDFTVGEKLEEWMLNNNSMNAEEMGSYFEGDILHMPVIGANGIIEARFRWPEGVVPYIIHKDFTASERLVIERAIASYRLFTCIRFRPFRTGDVDYISIEKGPGGCFSSVGRVGGKQVVNLPAQCLVRIGTSIHELMHAVGFFHEQSRLDRDIFVEILWQNIEAGKESNFRKENSNAFRVPYDYGSVMHYSERAFSKNNQLTIRTKRANVRIGQREGFSRSDILKIQLMYNGCRGRPR